jgi:hypothetical protein
MLARFQAAGGKVNWDVVNANFDKWLERWNKEIQVK